MEVLESILAFSFLFYHVFKLLRELGVISLCLGDRGLPCLKDQRLGGEVSLLEQLPK